VLVETYLQDVTRQVRHLLSCESVHVMLGCPVPELRHPLLNQLSLASYAVVADSGAISGTALLQHEYFRALCDVSLYKGQLSASSAMHWCIEGMSINSIAAAPLEVSTAGTSKTGGKRITGIIVCTDTRPDAFSYGERLLLQRYLPQIAELLVQIATDYLSLRTKNGAAQVQVSSTIPESHNMAQPATFAGSLAAQLKILDPHKNEFISMLSHELRSPLTAIKGYTILLRAYGINGDDSNDSDNDENSGRVHTGFTSVEELTPMRQREYLDIIMEQTNHLEVLISDLLDISRMQAGRLALRYTQVDIADLCSSVIQLVQQHADQQYPGRHTFRCVIAENTPTLWTDAHRMRQILTNLLENAVKYSPEGGLIEILVHFPGTFVTSTIPTTGSGTASTSDDIPAKSHASQQDMFAITIRDNGIGIALQQQSHLFQPFSRLEHPLTQEVPGAGLGLYITHKLVEAMGGSITLESTEGKGTSITCHLPIKQPDTVSFASIGTC